MEWIILIFALVVMGWIASLVIPAIISFVVVLILFTVSLIADTAVWVKGSLTHDSW